MRLLTTKRFEKGNQLAALTLHALFSHASRAKNHRRRARTGCAEKVCSPVPSYTRSTISALSCRSPRLLVWSNHYRHYSNHENLT